MRPDKAKERFFYGTNVLMNTGIKQKPDKEKEVDKASVLIFTPKLWQSDNSCSAYDQHKTIPEMAANCTIANRHALHLYSSIILRLPLQRTRREGFTFLR